LNGCFNLRDRKYPNWNSKGDDWFGEVDKICWLAGNGFYRGATEIADAPLLPFIFENCRPVTLAGRVGLIPAIQFASKQPKRSS